MGKSSRQETAFSMALLLHIAQNKGVFGKHNVSESAGSLSWGFKLFKSNKSLNISVHSTIYITLHHRRRDMAQIFVEKVESMRHSLWIARCSRKR